MEDAITSDADRRFVLAGLKVFLDSSSVLLIAAYTCHRAMSKEHAIQATTDDVSEILRRTILHPDRAMSESAFSNETMGEACKQIGERIVVVCNGGGQA